MPEKIRFDGDVITSRQNRRVVELMKLDDRRAREKSRLFRFDGVKLLCEALRRGVELDSVFLRALNRIAKKENDGSPQHRFFIGLAYLNGIDVETNYEKALKLIRAAAEAWRKQSEM